MLLQAGACAGIRGQEPGNEPHSDGSANAADSDTVDATPDTDLSPDADTDTTTDGTGDTDVIVDTARPGPGALPVWGPGLTVVGGDMETSFPPVFVGDRARSVPPELTVMAVGDVDEDGEDEVIITSRPADVRAPAIARTYHLDRATWTLAEDLTSRVASPPATGLDLLLGLIDLDGDGHLDAVRGNLEDTVQWGRGDGTFEVGTQALDGLQTCGVLTGANLWDVDADGWSDWVIGPDQCMGRVHVLRRAGPRRWVEETSWVTGSLDGLEVSAVLTVPTPTEQLHLVVGDRSPTLDEPGWLAGPRILQEGDALQNVSRTPSPIYWTDIPRWVAAGVLDVASMGAATEDLDGDGWLDVVLTVGMSPVSLWAGSASGFVDRTPVAGVAFGVDPQVEIPLPWSLALVDFDRDGRLDIFSTFGDDAVSFTLQDGGGNRNMLWWSRGPWDYVEVGLDVGLTTRGGWLAMTAFDLEKDGDADLGMGGNGQRPTLLRNQIANGNHGVSFQLVGTSSNREALGATIDVSSAGLGHQHRTVTLPANFDSIAPPVQFFGVGTATKLGRVQIRWPSGWTQVLQELPVDTMHTLVEPEVFAIDDPDRAAPADGTTRMGITIRPRHTDGQVNPAATVRLSIDGPGTLVEAQPAFANGLFHAEVIAPSAPGATRVTITVDGVPYAVRPRLTWE